MLVFVQKLLMKQSTGSNEKVDKRSVEIVS